MPRIPTRYLLFGPITEETYARILDDLGGEEAPCELWICSKGGDVGAALAIADLLAAGGHTAVATGQCMSAAVIVLLGAKVRYATRNTIFMLHAIQPEADAPQLPLNIPLLDELERLRVLAEKRGRITLPGIEASLNPEEAIKIGLVQEILK